MGFFSHVGVVLSGQNALDTSIADLELKKTPLGAFLISTSGANGGIASYEIGPTGSMSLEDTHFFSGFQTRLDSSEISVFGINGSNYVVTGSIGSQLMLGQRLLDNGDLGATTSFGGFAGKNGAMSAMEESVLAGGRFFFLANQGGNMLNVYRVGANANHIADSSFKDTDNSYAAGIVDMAEAKVAGKTYLLTLSAKENGISCFGVNETNGKLQHCGSFGAKQGLGIYAPTDIEVVSTFGATYAIVASSGTSSLSVLKINSQGQLSRADHILDTLNTRFGGVTAVETVKIDGRVYVIAGGSDDGLSLFIMLPGGRLQYLDTIVQTTSNRLGNVQDIAATQVGSDIHVFTTSGTSKGISQFQIDLPALGENKIGGDGNQTLIGTGDSEIVSGGGGNDKLFGGFGNDYIYDGDGADTLTGGGGGDVFILTEDGKKDKILDYQPYYDWIDLSAFSMLYSHRQLDFTSTDTGAIVKYRGETIEITHGGNKPLKFHQVFWKTFSGPDRPAWDLETKHKGTTKKDKFVGTYLIDIMTGGGGHDVLKGEAGSDTLHGGNGNDQLFGGYSADRLFGGNGNDRLFGNEGNDRIIGGKGNDKATLGSGNDISYLGEGNDKAYGGLGNDRIYGQSGDDKIKGDAGNDTIFGDAGKDTLSGGQGNDQIRAGSSHDTVFGDAGNDKIWLQGGNDKGFGGKDNDRIDGGPGDDRINGNEGKDILIGGTGDDVLSGAHGNDILRPGAGNDTAAGGAGDDFIFGGKGNDKLMGNDGNDRLSDKDGNNEVLGGGGNDKITLGKGNDLARGEGGNDWIDGGKGADRLFGGAGKDTLKGGSDKDVIKGGGGNDRIFAGQGNDRVDAGGGNDFVGGGVGRDSVDLGSGNDTYVDQSTGKSKAADKIIGGAGNDKITGGNGNETIKGGLHKDTLKGNSGKDFIFGEDGNDRIFGGTGDDFLHGGKGNDTIEGSAGKDTLVGGSGKDIFVFQKNNGSDRIKDFANGSDKIRLDITGLSFQKLKITPTKGGTKIGYGSGDLVLEGTSHWHIGAEDFIFG